MKILIKNCNLISMSKNREKYEPNMDILIEDNKIKRIDRNINEDCEKVINARGKVVMPGLINAHSHISMSIFRETVDGLKTQGWLKQKIWPIEDNLTNEDIYFATMLSCIEMIETGCTCVNDMYFLTDNIIKAALESGIRMQTTMTLMGYDINDLSRLEKLKSLLENYKYETITFNAGIHGLYTSNEDYVKKCVELAEEKNLPIHMHFCENIQEREDIKRDYNVDEPSEVIKRDLKGIHNILAHSVKVSDKDIQNLKETNTYIAHCPVSNLKLGCGIAPVAKMIEEGLCVSLGTDGQGSGSNLDMFETMKFTALLQKGINENPENLPAYEVLKMATVNGAKALNLSDIGKLEEGKLADLIIINMEETITNAINNIFAEIVYNVKGYNVDTTIINGKILMENRKLNNINKKEIIQQCSEIIERFKNAK